MYAKFKVSCYTCSREMGESQNLKSRSRDPSPRPSDLILHVLLLPLVINIYAKFEVSSFNHFPDMERFP